MNAKLWILLKNQYLNQSNLNALKYEKDKKRRNRTIGTYAAFAVVFLMIVIYSFLIAYGYGYLGMTDAIPGYSLLICSIIALFFTFMKTNGFLFAFKDYDSVMALPFTTGTVITAKFLYMYINNLIFSLCVMLPMCAGFAIWAHPGIPVYVIWFVITCFTPLIPMAIAAAVGAIITAVGSRFRFKIFVQAALSLVLIVAVSSLGFLFNTSGSNTEFFKRLENIGEMIQTQIHRFYPVSILFDRAVSEENLLYVLAFVAVSLTIYLVFVTLVSVKYLAINTALMTSSARSNYKVSRMKKSSVIRAIVGKEMKRFTSSITYLMNEGIGMMLAVIGSVICLVVGVDKVLATMELGGMQQAIYCAVPLIFAVPLTMTCTTSVSWSLEGKNLWIMKSLPIEESTIFKGKMAFNAVLLVPAAIICDTCLILAIRPGIVLAVLYVVVSLAAVAFSTTLGMWVGKKFPNFEWENEVEVIKQGMTSFLGIFVNMILMIALAAVTIALGFVMDGRIVLGVIAAVLFGVSAVFYIRVNVTSTSSSK